MKWVNRKKGFTLIEVITVVVIIGIAASILVPTFSNQIYRMNVRDIARSAQWAQDATMALTGLQYANTTSGNPRIMNWADAIPAPARNTEYVYVQAGQTYSNGSQSCFRVAPANIAAANEADRRSEGMSEFYKRTMNTLPPPTWRGAGPIEDQATCSVYFLLAGSNINSSVTAVDPGTFVKYEFAYSEYFMTKDGSNYAVYNGVRFHTPGASQGDAAGSTPTADAGWHVYRHTGTGLVYFGSI